MNHPVQQPTGRRTLRGAVLAALLCLPLMASASRKDDAQLALTDARGAVQAAERAGAPQSAPVQLKIARDGLAAAQAKYDDREWEDVQRWSQRARYDALLAEARSRQSRAEALTAEIEAGIQTLQNEVGG